MFTGVDKAVVAAIMAVLYIINSVWGIDIFSHITEEYVSVIIAVITPFLVYWVPNKPV